MSIGGLMRTSVSGMNAQANRLGSVSDNIANSDTTGYKKSQTEFSSLVLASGKGQYNSGMVEAQTRTLVSEQGGVSYTTNSSSVKAVDLAIQGAGFLIVDDGSGGKVLTRAGAFRNDGEGNLVNAAGYTLQGYPLPMNADGVLNGYAGLQNVRIDDREMRVTPTTAGTFRVNLDKGASLVPATVPGTDTEASGASAIQANAFRLNGAGTNAAGKLTFDLTIDGATPATTVEVTNAGGPDGITIADIVTQINAAGLDVTASAKDGKLVLTSTNTGTAASIALGNVQVYSDATTVSSVRPTGIDTVATTTGKDAVAKQTQGSLPSANAPDATYSATDSIVTYDNTGKEVVFDLYMTKTAADKWEYVVYNRADAGTGATAPFPYANGPVTNMDVTFNADGKMLAPADGAINIQIPNGQLMRLDLAGTQQLDGKYQPLDAKMNGNPPELVSSISIDKDGTIYANFASGTKTALYKVPLAQVQSPDNMEQVSGNAFKPGLESGTLLVGFGGESGLGSLIHGALEESTVDIASELTTMIESQRSYTANSKVFQTGSEILDVLVNLKR